MIDKDQLYSFVTYAMLPSLLMATELGRLPTAILVTIWFDPVSTTETEEALPLATYKREPFGVMATARGKMNPLMVLSTLPLVSCSVTELAY